MACWTQRRTAKQSHLAFYHLTKFRVSHRVLKNQRNAEMLARCLINVAASVHCTPCEATVYGSRKTKVRLKSADGSAKSTAEHLRVAAVWPGGPLHPYTVRPANHPNIPPLTPCVLIACRYWAHYFPRFPINTLSIVEWADTLFNACLGINSCTVIYRRLYTLTSYLQRKKA